MMFLIPAWPANCNMLMKIIDVHFAVFAFTHYTLEDQKHHIRCFRFYSLQFGGSETSYSLFSLLLATVWKIRNIIFAVFAFTRYSLEDQKHHIRCFRFYWVQFGGSETTYSLFSVLLATVWKIRNIFGVFAFTRYSLRIRNIRFIVFAYTGWSLEYQKYHVRCFRFYWLQFG